MREFIKNHPWRLEVVPFLMVVFAFVLSYYYRERIPVTLFNTFQLEPLQLRHLQYFLRSCLLLAVLGQTIVCNHSMIALERRKTFIVWAPIGVAIIGVAGWYLSGWLFASVWISIIAVSVILEVFIEKTRRFRPIEVKAERMPEISVEPNQPFYYREQRQVWTYGLINIIQNALMIPGIWAIYGAWPKYNVWMGSLVISTSLFAALVMSHVTFAISRENIKFQVAHCRTRNIPISTVKDCCVYDFAPFEGKHKASLKKYDGMIQCSPKLGPCLRVNTNDGKAYLLGVKDPEYFCRLIKIIKSQEAS